MKKYRESIRNFSAIMLSFFVLLLTVPALPPAATAAMQSTSSPTVKVHYLDVGQADSILIQSGGANMLIDGGNRDDDIQVKAYLKKQGVKKLDYVVGTHPHEDHIGGLASVIEAFDVSRIIMPKVTANTKTFENLLEAIKGKGLKITSPVPGSTFKLGGASFTVLSPNSAKYEDLNNYSVVLRMTFGKSAFLFQGDAESDAEKEILNKGWEIRADVIKLGHHGSSSSSSYSYLNKVKPQYAIISCGKDNDYGHPHPQILKRLAEKKIRYYRTDLNGTVVCTSDGKSLKFNTSGGTVQGGGVSSSSSSSSSSTSTAAVVYVTKSGEKYHLENCSSLRYSKIKMSLKDAKAKGYLPCKSCNPPN